MKVSVYCLVYNHELYLESALEGFINQKTDFEYEVFVHDDASTDQSRKIIEEYAKRYPHIIKPIFQKENQYSKGVKILSTYILPKMTGKYIAVCEGDDYWIDQMKLQSQVDFLDNHPEYVACVHNTRKMNMRTGKTCEMYFHEKDDDLTFSDVVQGGSCSYHTSSLMYRMEYAENRPDFFKKAKRFGDYPLAIYLSLSGKIRFLNKVMSIYRVETNSSWTKANIENPHRNATFHLSVAKMLKSVDEYTEYEYTEMLNDLILENQYSNLYFDEKYEELRKEPYKKIYKSKSLGYRFKTHIKQRFNKIYHIYRRKKYS